MNCRNSWIGAGVLAAALLAGGTGLALANAGEDEGTPITGEALDRATAAALTHTGGGRVTGTEVGDEQSYYEVEVMLTDGRQVDVQLDESFTVVGTDGDADGPNDAAGPSNDALVRSTWLRVEPSAPPPPAAARVPSVIGG